MSQIFTQLNVNNYYWTSCSYAHFVEIEPGRQTPNNTIVRNEYPKQQIQELSKIHLRSNTTLHKIAYRSNKLV